MSNRGELFVVAAPSGAGKTSLVNALVASDGRLAISVSHTTRAPRPGEVHGRHYHFVTEAEFRSLLEKGEFLEHARVFDHWYGTHRASTLALLDSGRDVILEIDWQGARQVRASFPDCHSVFILPPSLQALEARLAARGQDSAEIIASRMARARAEIEHCPEFEHVVVNDNFSTALGELRELFERCRTGSIKPGPARDELLAELLGKG